MYTLMDTLRLPINQIVPETISKSKLCFSLNAKRCTEQASTKREKLILV